MCLQAFGPLEQMSESVVTQMGCISQGFVDSELEHLPFLLDNLEEIGRCGWKESQVMKHKRRHMLVNIFLIFTLITDQDVPTVQVRSVWKAVAKHNALTAQQLGAVDMVALNQFICGLTSSEMRQLDLDAFKFVPHTDLTCHYY